MDASWIGLVSMSIIRAYNRCQLNQSPSLRFFFPKGRRATILRVVDDHIYGDVVGV